MTITISLFKFVDEEHSDDPCLVKKFRGTITALTDIFIWNKNIFNSKNNITLYHVFNHEDCATLALD